MTTRHHYRVLLRSIAMILVATFAARDIVWAGPDIAARLLPSSLQIQSFFRPTTDVALFDNVIDATIRAQAMPGRDYAAFCLRLNVEKFLTLSDGTVKRVFIVPDFSADGLKRGEYRIIPCHVIDAGTGLELYSCRRFVGPGFEIGRSPEEQLRFAQGPAASLPGQIVAEKHTDPEAKPKNTPNEEGARTKQEDLYEKALAERIARSRNYMKTVDGPIKVGFVISIYKRERLLRPVESPLGQDYLRVKIKQLEELFGGTGADWEILLVDDGEPDGEFTPTGTLALEIAGEYPEEVRKKIKVLSLQKAVNANIAMPEDERNPVLSGIRNAKKDTKKGGSIVYGMYEALSSGCDYIFYTDTDLSFHLGQSGILLKSVREGERENVGLAIGSREYSGSVITGGRFRWLRSMVYHVIVRVLIPQMMSVKDSQAAFKCFSREAALKILPYSKERGFSFDSELILLAALAGYTIDEVGVAWKDIALGSNVVMSDPGKMLKQLWDQRRRYGQGLYDGVSGRAPPKIDDAYEHKLESALKRSTFEGLSSAEAAAMVKDVWGINGVLEQAKGYRAAAPLRIITPGGKVYYLKPLATSLQPAKFVTELLIFLKERESATNIKVPEIVMAINGAYFVKRGKFYWTLEKKVELPAQAIEVLWEDSRVSHFEALGRAVAKLHDITQASFLPKLDDVMKYEFLASDLFTEQREDLNAAYGSIERETAGIPAEQLTRGRRLILENKRFIFDRLDVVETRFSNRIYRSLPWAVCHGDFALQNAWFGRTGDVAGVVDFNKSRWAPRLEDIKNSVLTDPEHGRVYEPEHILAFVRGYQETSSRKLSARELETFLDVIEATFLLAYLGMIAYKAEKLDDATSDRYDAFLFALMNHRKFLSEREAFRGRLLGLASPEDPAAVKPAALTGIIQNYLLPGLDSALSVDAQISAVRSLGLLGADEAVGRLTDILSDPMRHPLVKKAVCEALGWLAAPEAAGPMADLLKDESQRDEVRAAAAYGLGRLVLYASATRDGRLLNELRLFGAEDAVGRLSISGQGELKRRSEEAHGAFRRAAVVAARRDIADRSLSVDERLSRLMFLEENQRFVERPGRLRHRIDLHQHTYRSDGEATPSDVVFRAWQEGMRAIAIVDHNTTAASEEALGAGRILGVEVIIGVEMDLYDDELGIDNFHLLGYVGGAGGDETQNPAKNEYGPALERVMASYRETRMRRFNVMREKFNVTHKAQGFVLTEEDLRGKVPDQPHKYHLGAALFKKYGSARLGVSSSRQATQKYFPADLVAYDGDKDGMPAEEVIPLAKKAGLVMVVAHPGEKGVLKDHGTLRSLVTKYSGSVRGIEVYSGKHNAQDTEAYAGISSELGLIQTLGSDNHDDHPGTLPALGAIDGNMSGNMPSSASLHTSILESLKPLLSPRPAEPLARNPEAHAAEFLRDLNDSGELSVNAKEAIISRLASGKKLVLVFEKSLGAFQSPSPLGIFRFLRKLSKKPEYKKILGNLVIIETDAERIKGKIQEPLLEKDTEVFVFASLAYRNKLTEIEGQGNLSSFYIDDGGFIQKEGYCPLLEIVTIALWQHIRGFEAIHAELKRKGIDLTRINIAAFERDEKTGVFLFSLKKHDIEKLPGRYMLIRKALQAA